MLQTPAWGYFDEDITATLGRETVTHPQEMIVVGILQLYAGIDALHSGHLSQESLRTGVEIRLVQPLLFQQFVVHEDLVVVTGLNIARLSPLA